MAATVAAPLERRLGEIAGRDRDHLVQLARLDQHHGAVRRSARNIDGAARDVQAALNAAAADLPGDLPTLPSFRKANPAAAPVLILALTSETVPPSAIYDAADTVVAQRIVAGRGRRRGDGERRRAAGDPRAGRSRRALAAMGLVARDGAHRDRRRQRARPDRRVRRRGQTQHDRAPTTSCAAPEDFGAHRGARPATARWCGSPTSRRSSAGVRNTRSAGWFNGAAGRAAHRSPSRPTPTSSRPSTASSALLPELRRWIPAGHRDLRPDRPHRHHPRQRARHAVDARGHHRAGDAGGVRVPAPR